MTQSPRDLALQTSKFQREQERLFQDLLGILDALDHACDHWQQAEQDHAQPHQDFSAAPPSAQTGFGSIFQSWQRFWRSLLGQKTIVQPSPAQEDASSDPMAEVLGSAREGVEMIRRSLLDVLRQRQVLPLEVMGQPFDPEQMYALGRQESEEIPENYVLQEVVRGYLWQNRVLREAQVMVAMPPELNKS